MALSQKLEMRQGQSLVMTPQLQQAIKLLQLSNIDLTTYVEQELERNPLLEPVEQEQEGGDPAPNEKAANSNSSDNDTGSSDSPLKLSEDAPATNAESDLDADFSNVYEADSPVPAASPGGADGQSSLANIRGSGGSFENSESSLENTLSHEPTLVEHLTEQLQIAIADPAKRMIGVHLIDLIDESGYLSGSIEQVGELLGASPEEIDSVLSVLQTFDPAGVCACNLADCLRAQLKEKDRLDPAMEALIENLHLLAKGDRNGLMRACEIDEEDLADMILEIRQLNPKPGLAFGTTEVQAVIPDVFIRQTPEGGWSVELNSDTLPRVLVNNRYYSEVNSTAKTKEDKTYISECLHNANWLIKSLDQRAKTILKVSKEIIRQQDAFFVHGIQHLRPLNLRAVAEAIQMHESTVSRVTANKYMSTPRGIFELKYFFTAAIPSASGAEAHSAEAVRHRIRDMIESESVEKVLSDDRIVELLKDAGVEIARRTVAKYRENMHIPSSVERRRRLKAFA